MIRALTQRFSRVPVRQLSGYIGGVAVRGSEVLGKFVLYMLVARELGAHDSGLFFLCFTWVGLAATAARMGFERAMMRHIPAELAVGETRAAKSALLIGMMATGAGGIVMGIVTALVAAPAARWVFHQPDLATPLAWAGLMLVPQTMLVSVACALIGLKRGVLAQLFQNTLWPILTLIALLLGAKELLPLLLALTGALTLCALAGAAAIYRERRQFNTTSVTMPSSDREVLPPIWRTALPLCMVELIQISLNSLPMLALGAFASAADVGAFSVANRISMLIWVVSLSIGTISAPLFAEYHRLRQMDKLRAANRLTRRTVTILGLPAVLAMMIVPGWLLGLIGHDFTIAAAPLMVMSIGQMVNCLTPCQDILLAMTGHGRTLRLINILQLIVCVALGAALIPLYGMMGAAILTTIFTALGAIGTTVAARRLLPEGC
ncbi:MAG TPA: oligosaccharide flippase family protein [Magnetospirillaceae bacterium]|jgi:O-antigen/teichoic acid export membrane protein